MTALREALQLTPHLHVLLPSHSAGMDNDKPRGTVRDFMTKEVVSVPSHMNVYFLAGMFLKANYRRLPVIDDGKLVGAITRFDILRVIQTNLKQT